jgi:hypothetical protein
LWQQRRGVIRLRSGCRAFLSEVVGQLADLLKISAVLLDVAGQLRFISAGRQALRLTRLEPGVLGADC